MDKSRNKLKILSPVDRLEEIEPLIGAGADELYAGVVPDGWRDRLVSPNQRTFESAQFQDETQLSKAVQVAAGRSVPLHLTLNAPVYTPENYDELVSLAVRAKGWGVESFIVGDPGLMTRLHERDNTLKITLSTMAGAMNRGWLDFYRELGLYRAVFPRHLNISEMASLVKGGGGIDFEAFVLIGKCPNEEAFCSFQHISPTKRWPCEIDYRIFDDTLEHIKADDHRFADWHLRWSRVERRFGCGLCGLEELERIGVKVAKLVGRGGPTAGKVANVELVRRFITGGLDREAAKTAYAERFGYKCTSEVCYFPELFS